MFQLHSVAVYINKNETNLSVSFTETPADPPVNSY